MAPLPPVPHRNAGLPAAGGHDVGAVRARLVTKAGSPCAGRHRSPGWPRAWFGHRIPGWPRCNPRIAVAADAAERSGTGVRRPPGLRSANRIDLENGTAMGARDTHTER